MPAHASRASLKANSSADQSAGRRVISSDIPARLDRLPWSRFHILILIGLGITWILDGIEVTIVGAIAPVLRDRETLGLSAAQIGNAASAYVAGAVIGALVFGWLTDRFGRRTVFYATLIVYLTGVLLTATSWNFLSFALFRAITGLGIGGEYAAINSAIDELIPARFRGRRRKAWGKGVGRRLPFAIRHSESSVSACVFAKKTWKRLWVLRVCFGVLMG